MTTVDTNQLTELATRLVEMAKARGADVAEAQARQGWELNARVRLGETELVSEAGYRGVYLRVLRAQRAAFTSTSDVSEAGLETCVNDAIELSNLSQADELAGPPAAELLSKAPFKDLDLFDESVSSIDAKDAIARAARAEHAALSSDARLTLSEGATFSRVVGGSALVLSNGFCGTQLGSYASLSVEPVVVDVGDKRRRGYYWDAKRHLEDLMSDEEIGLEAARRTLRQLGARKVVSTSAPVVFDADAARSILGMFASCIVGGALWRKSSYLISRVNTQVASHLFGVVDDPLVLRAPGSRVFDGDGLPARRNVVVEGGVLKSYLLDTYSARKLGLECTHSGSRSGASVSSSTTNFIMQPGNVTQQQLIGETQNGLYVTEMMGHGFNPVTGDLSCGASGYWIQNGELAYPVSEITISGNLDQMLKSVDRVANDLVMRTSTVAPTFRVAEMTIGGT